MIYKSPHAPVTIPETSITDYVLRRAAELGDKPALIDGPSGRTYTYDQLPGYIKRLAAGFAEHGLKRGDVFAIYCPNLPEFVLAFHAVASLGASTTMVPPLFTDDEIGQQLRDSGAKYLLTIPALLPKAREVAPASGVEKIFVIGEAEGAISWSSLLSGTDNPADANVEIDTKTDIVALPYSSGTTGLPKGVMLTPFPSATRWFAWSRCITFTDCTSSPISVWPRAPRSSPCRVMISINSWACWRSTKLRLRRWCRRWC
jgi:acyl-CoA synthetase (AMP-forming)/AMP-acid ligase II